MVSPAVKRSKPGLAADRQRGKTGAALAQRPFQQRIVAAADDRRRLGTRQPGRPRNAGGQPVIELGLGEQPAAGDLGARHAALGHHLIDLALLEAEIGGGFGGGEKLHDADLHCICIFFENARKCAKKQGGERSPRRRKMRTWTVWSRPLALPRGLEPLFSP